MDFHEDLDSAARQALRDMIELIQERAKLSRTADGTAKAELTHPIGANPKDPGTNAERGRDSMAQAAFARRNAPALARLRPRLRPVSPRNFPPLRPSALGAAQTGSSPITVNRRRIRRSISRR